MNGEAMTTNGKTSETVPPEHLVEETLYQHYHDICRQVTAQLAAGRDSDEIGTEIARMHNAMRLVGLKAMADTINSNSLAREAVADAIGRLGIGRDAPATPARRGDRIIKGNGEIARERRSPGRVGGGGAGQGVYY